MPIVDCPFCKGTLTIRIVERGILLGSCSCGQCDGSGNDMTETHLCPECEKDFAVCDGEPRFGTGYGNDNVYCCSGYKMLEGK